MRLSLGKPTRLLRNQSLSSFLSLTLSTALVLLPVWPARGARAASAERAPEPALSAPAREFAPRPAVVSPLAPSLTATKTDSFSDPGNDGKAEPGQIITYTVTVTNNGPDDAANVQFNDTVDANTTLVPGSVATQPIAASDSYNVLGNVRIQPNAAAGLLANDCDPDNGGPCSSAGLTASGPSTSANGGNVTVNANGSFSYNPPPGFEGADSFTYTVTDATGNTDTATVSLTVNEVVWFVDDTAPAGGDGRLTNPYNGLAPLGGTDLDEPFDFIFVSEGSGAYGGGIALEDNQRLIGQGTGLDAALALFGVSAPAHSDVRPAATSRPTLANSAGNVITLANNNAVLHLNASATVAASAAISGSAVGGNSVSNVGASASGAALGVSLANLSGAFSMSNSSVSSSSTGAAIIVNGGTSSVAFAATSVSQSGGGSVVNVQSRTGGIVSFDGASSVSATNSTVDAVSLLSNAGTTSFAGPVTLNTSGARGLVADSGTVNLTSSGNTVSATGAAAVDIENLAANINFATTFSTNSTGRGLRVDNVSGSASFGNTAVNGSANTGVLLTDNSAAVSFSDLDIAPAAGVRALHAVNNTGAIFSASGVVATSVATAVEVTGASAASRTPLNLTLTSVTASGALTAPGIVLTNTSATGSPGGFGVTGTGTTDSSGGAIAATAAGVDAVALTDAERVALKNFDLGDAAAANNEFPNTQVSVGDDAISITRVTPGAGGTYGLDLDNVKIADTGGHGINGSGGGNVGLRFAGGEIINAGDNLALVNESAMYFGSGFPSTDQITGVVSITNSIFSGFTGYGFSVENAGDGTLNMTVSGSTFQNNDSTNLGNSGIQVIADGSQSSGTPKVNLHVLNTNFTNIDLDGVEVTIDPGGVGNVTIDGGTTNSPKGDNAFHLVSGSPDSDDTESLTSLIQNVTVNSMRGTLVFLKGGAGTYHATVQNSTLNSGDTDDGAGAHIGRGVEILMDADNGVGEVLTAKVKVHNVTLNNIGVDGIFVQANEVVAGSTADVTLTNNTVGTATAPVGRSNTGEGIELIARDPMVMNLSVQNNSIFTRGTSSTSEATDLDSETTATLNATIVGNTFQNGGGATANSFDINTEASSAKVCLDLRSNSATGGSGANYQLGAVAGSVFNFEIAGSGPLTAADVQGQQTSGTATVAGTINKNGGVNCAEPTAPNTPSLPAIAALHPTVENGANFQLAAADTAPQNAPAGSSALNAFADGLRKIPQGLANAVSGQLLGLGFGDETPRAAAAPATLAVAGETVSINIGTLRAGDSVTITFQVTVADPFPTNVQPPQVSNQGTVTADGGISVLTDDPSEPGGADPTVTPILTPPTISVNDATVAEPATGSTDMLFTVSLSHPYTQTTTVNFSTANGGANSATAGTDYTTTSGAVTFAAGETVQTVSVPVLADGTAAEGDEHFLVNLSAPVNGIIADGQATGTITDETVASPLIISELRTNGPSGANDDFVELLNTTDADITVIASDGSGSGWAVVKSGADCNATPVVVGVIPEGTVIPARGNYLFTGSAYSLSGYPAGNGTTATGDAALSADIELNHNVGLFSTASLANISTANRLDAVGFGTNTGGNCDLLREGTTIGAVVGFSVDYSFVRKVEKGLTVDTTDNAADFIVVDTNGTSVGGGNPQRLGAPGPENLSSPRGPVPCSATAGAAKFGRELIDPGVSAASAPNVARDNTSDPSNNSTFGTIDFRRTWTNNTGAPVTRLRFRITNLTTFPSEVGTADLRARTSSAVVVSTTSGNKTVLGTTLETPPAQPNGGGINASLSAGSITLATPLANGASVNLRFLFGIQQTGDYDVGIVLESLPGSGKDFWRVTGDTEDGGHTDGGCNKPPVADAGDDQTLECSNGQASVTLDGTGSTDPDGDTPLTYEWFEGATLLGTGQSLNVSLPVGSHTITLKVTDPSGDSSTDTVIVSVVDTTPPQVTAPPDVTVYTGPGATSCGATVSDATLGTATALDGCEGSVPVNRTGVPAGNFFPVGPTEVVYKATDAAGNEGTDIQIVTVIDNTPPVVTPPANITTNADPDSCSATVNPGTASATDNCEVDTIVGTRSDNQPLNAPYPVGTTTITWTATDVSGNQATAQQTVTVVDAQAPTLTSSVSVTTMGPPFNHALINVGLSATASDNCGVLGPFQVFVYSDEDDGAAPHSPDAANIGIGSLRLRRERDGGSDGRVYLVVVKVTDASGNTSASCNTVTVPLSNSAGDQSAVNAQAAAASSFCSANGSAPAGYFVVGP